MGTHSVKIVVIYPRPQDEEAFEKVYMDEHVPMAEQKLKGMTRLVLTKVTGSPQGKVIGLSHDGSPFFLLDELTQCIESDGGKEVDGARREHLHRRPALCLSARKNPSCIW